MSSDVVFIDRLSLRATVGADWWGRIRPQPIFVSVFVHLTPKDYFTRVAKSDDLKDTVDYSLLAKVVMKYVEEAGVGQEGGAFGSVDELIDGVVDCAFGVAGESGGEVRVVVELPKMVQLAQGGVVFERVVMAEKEGGGGREEVRRKVCVKDVSLAVVVGVNEPERREKQRVVVDIEVDEAGRGVDYPGLVRDLVKNGEQTQHLTLEKLTWDLIQTACLHLGSARTKAKTSVTIRTQKPSAVSFGQASGVQITRSLSDF